MAALAEDEAKVEVKAGEEGTLTEKAMGGFSFAKSEVRGKSAWMQECNIRASLPSKDQIKVEMVHLHTMRKFSGVFSKEDLDSIGFAQRDPAEVSLEIIRAAFFGDEEIDATAVVTPVKQSRDEGSKARVLGDTAVAAKAEGCLFSECNALRVEVIERARRKEYIYLLVINEDDMDPAKKNELCIQQLRHQLQRVRDENAALTDLLKSALRPLFCKFKANSVSSRKVQWSAVEDPAADVELVSLEEGGCQLKVRDEGVYRITGVINSSSSSDHYFCIDDAKLIRFYNSGGKYESFPVSWMGSLSKGQVISMESTSLNSQDTNRLFIEKLPSL